MNEHELSRVNNAYFWILSSLGVMYGLSLGIFLIISNEITSAVGLGSFGWLASFTVWAIIGKKLLNHFV